MKSLKFKTNIKCAGCITTVTPFLDKQEQITNWEVDTLNPDKILTVDAEGISADEIIVVLKEAGYEARPV